MVCFKIDLFVIASFVIITLVYGQRARTCQTPNSETANCVPIRSCPILYNAVTSQDQRQLEFLRKSQCGYSGSPFVCCGSYDNYRQVESDEDFGWGGNNRRTTPGSSEWGGGNTNRGNNGGAFDWEGGDDRPQWGSNNSNRRTNQGSSNIPDRSSCGFQAADRILSGQATGLTEFPWMALLQYRKSSGNLVFSCGGTLISPEYVLTAAHCVRGAILTKIGPLMNVRLGEYNTETEKDCSNQLGFEICNDKAFDSGVEKVIVHPDYRDNSADRHHDIALIKLKRKAPNTDFIKPICLPSSSEGTRVGDRLVVAGWGRTENSNSSPVKLKLWVPVAEKSQCTTRFRSAGVSLGNRQLCAGGERGKDSCNGDSGGPLMATTKDDAAQWYIEGIVSFGAKCGSEGWPGIYTKVSEYLDWIRDNAI